MKSLKEPGKGKGEVPSTSRENDKTTASAPSKSKNQNEKKKSSRLWERLGKESSSRFDQILGASGKDAQKQIQKSLQSQVPRSVPTKEDKDNFFLDNSTEGESKILIETRGKRQSSISYDEENPAEEQDLLEDVESVEAYLLENESRTALTVVNPAVYLPFNVRLTAALRSLFIPAAMRESVKEKMIEGGFRNYDDEGIYRGQKPFICRTNMRIIENRLLKQEGSHWFNEAGEVEREDLPFTKPLSIRSADGDENDEPLCTFVQSCSVEDFMKMEQKRINLNVKKRILQLYLESLTFTSHPLFSPEVQIATQLRTKCEEFVERKNLKVAQIAYAKLKILRQSLAKLQQINPLPAASVRGAATVREEIDVQRRHNLYRREIRECRQQWILEAEKDRSLISNILGLWSDLKETRKQSKFQATNLNLVIHKQKVKSKKTEEQKWKEELREEVEERFEEENEIWKRKNEEYKKELMLWKQERRARKEATKRQRKVQNEGIEELKEEEVLQMAQDQITLSLPELTKPEAPEKKEKDEIKQIVEDIFLRTRRPPGEPILDFVLLTTSSVTPSRDCPNKERQRRSGISKLNIWIRITINNKLVTQTKSFKMSDDFVVTFSSAFVMAVLSWPDDVKLEILEGSPLKQKLVAVLRLPLPSRSCIETSEEISLDTALFGDGSVGNEESTKKEIYGGKLQYKLCWKKGTDEESTHPPGQVPRSRTADYKKTSQAMTSESMEDQALDPNDPRNSESLAKIKLISSSSKTEPVFDLEGEEDAFCSAEEIKTSVRFRVLKLRSEGVPEFKGLERISAIESQILQKPLDKYEKRFESTKRKADRDGEGSEYGENERKVQAEDLVESIIRSLELQSSQATPSLTLQDLVQEEQIPHIGSIGELVTVLKPRRPLRPSRKRRGQVKGVGLTDQNVNLIIHISRGFHVPMRKEFADMVEEGTSSTGTESTAEDSFDSMVRPFVEVSFQRNIDRTHTSHGSNPTWNQQLVLPFKAPNNNFTSSSLQTVDDSVFFHLYDEVVFDLLNDERRRGNTVHHQIEKRWLGSLKIPFSTIYLQNKIEGTFRLDCPMVLLGYVADTTTLQTKGLEEDGTSGAPHLSLYLTIEPTLPPSKPLPETFESLEPNDVVREGKSYTASLKSRYPQRHFRTHVLDFFGKLVCLTRFIKPTAPPSEILDEEEGHEIERICWYVSLLPSLASVTKIPGMPTVWANVEQHINLGIGNTDEKAILLVNYLLYLNYEAYLLVGSGIPEGISCYALAKIDSIWKVFCPSSAINYDVYKPNCPLKAVYMLINEHNIYSNIQKYEDPPRLNFDAKYTSSWKPFFNSSFANPNLPTVQPDLFVYKPVNEAKWLDLKEKLQVILRDAVMKWRPSQRTPWNRYASKTQGKLLRSYEKASLEGKNLNPETSELAALLRAYKVCGVCVHQEYTTIASVVEAVYSTGIHSVQIPGSEFALAVEIVPYPGETASVWVYIASLQRKI